MLNTLSSATVTVPLPVLKCRIDRHMLSLNDIRVWDYRSADGPHMRAVLLDGGLKVTLSDMELGSAELILFPSALVFAPSLSLPAPLLSLQRASAGT